MIAIAPLMLEHRLIERMIAAIKTRVRAVGEKGAVPVLLLDFTLDFVRTYAEECHHGKEERILFPLLANKKMSDLTRSTMEDLINDHARCRQIADRLSEAKERLRGDANDGSNDVVAAMNDFVEFYPRHIEKEDRHFFIPVMEYLTSHEQDDLVEAFGEFDRKVIHDKYRLMVERLEIHR
jgi:hemerythrin-like domain-containing protein